MTDRSDKFAYTDPGQIKIGQTTDDVEALRALRDFIEREGLDPAKVLALVRAHTGELGRESKR